MKAFFTEETIYTTKTKRRLTPLAIQKLLDVLLIVFGIATCIIFGNEDASAGVVLILLGLARATSDYTEED